MTITGDYWVWNSGIWTNLGSVPSATEVGALPTLRPSEVCLARITADVKADYERIKARGANFTMPPTKVTGSTIAMLDDTCGNVIQLTQLPKQG